MCIVLQYIFFSTVTFVVGSKQTSADALYEIMMMKTLILENTLKNQQPLLSQKFFLSLYILAS